MGRKICYTTSSVADCLIIEVEFPCVILRGATNMKKILVTGATGFIGNYVIKELLKLNVEVIATSASFNKASDFGWFSKVKYIPFNFEAFNATEDYYQFFKEPDALIHLAWEGLPNYKSSFHCDINLPRHLALLKNMIENGLRDITVTGTCFEYGIKEGCLNENMPSDPNNSYAFAKDNLRKQLQEFQKKNDFKLRWIRLFYMYGKGQNSNSLFSQLDKALANNDEMFNMSGGEQLRDYLPVETVAAYTVKIAMQNEVEGIINCCSGQPISIKQLVKKYLAESGKHIELNLGYYPYTDYEPMAFWGNNKKLKTIIEHD